MAAMVVVPPALIVEGVAEHEISGGRGASEATTATGSDALVVVFVPPP